MMASPDNLPAADNNDINDYDNDNDAYEAVVSEKDLLAASCHYRRTKSQKSSLMLEELPSAADLPQDARTIAQLLQSSGVDQCEPAVVCAPSPKKITITCLPFMQKDTTPLLITALSLSLLPRLMAPYISLLSSPCSPLYSGTACD